MMTAQDIADVFNGLGVTKAAFGAMIQRLIVLDQYNKLNSALANARAEHAEARAAMAAAEQTLQAQVSAARAAADNVIGGGA